MDFRWIEWNTGKVEMHGASPEEAEQVVGAASRPFPLHRRDGRLIVWGSTLGGRMLQVVYLLDPDGAVFVIHARPLGEPEKRRFRRTHR